MSEDSKILEQARAGAAKALNYRHTRRGRILYGYADAGVDELIVPDFTLGPTAAKLKTLDIYNMWRGVTGAKTFASDRTTL